MLNKDYLMLNVKLNKLKLLSPLLLYKYGKCEICIYKNI